MTQQEIYEKLDNMLANPKSKNFMGHLVRAYFPITNVDKVWDRPPLKIRCAISGDELVSVEDIMAAMESQEYKDAFARSMSHIFDEQGINPLTEVLGDKKLGVTGKGTSTFMSFPVYREFYNWVVNKTLSNDKHINWILRTMRDNKSVVKPIEKPVKIAGATYTLGETEAFKKLKDAFK